MANAKNTAAVAELKARFENSDATVLTEYRGLTVAETTELRTKLGSDVTYSVAKNTMIKLAAQEAGIELDELGELDEGHFLESFDELVVGVLSHDGILSRESVGCNRWCVSRPG